MAIARRLRDGIWHASGVLVDGTTESPTYLHVTVLQEMTVER